MRSRWALAAALPALLTLLATPLVATGAECLVPSKPGGGFDLTCKLAKKALEQADRQAAKDGAAEPMRLAYLPGGIGAVTWNSVVSQRRAERDTLVAFSGGSLLNLALGKFGKASADDVRWVAALGTDYGMVAVRADSPYHTLRELLEALRRNPAAITIGAGGTVGSQDWFKMTLLAQQNGVDPKSLRFVAFEGGGESFTALMAGYVQAVSGDISEAMLHGPATGIRVLAVLSDARLPPPLDGVPTAREQGYDVSWPIIRGVYMGPGVPDADYRRWVKAFDRVMADPSFDRLRASYGLYPMAMTGAQLTEYVNKSVDGYRRRAREMGLLK